jgi:hypothetical protein
VEEVQRALVHVELHLHELVVRYRRFFTYLD